MGTIAVVLLLSIALSAAVLVYVAYPYRGERTPLHPALGEVMRRGVSSLPTIDVEAREDDRADARREARARS